MAFKKVEHVADEYFIPESQGEFVEGILSEGAQVKTAFGMADYVLVGDKKVLLSGGLIGTLTKDSGLFGKLVRITFEGISYNKSTKRNYKSFVVEVDDDSEGSQSN